MNAAVEDRVNEGRKRLSDAGQAYIASGGEARWITPILVRYGHIPLDDLTQAKIDELAREMYPTQSDSSVLRWFYTPICTVLNYAAERDWCHYRKIKKPKIKTVAPKWAELEWLEKLWSVSGAPLVAFTTLLPYTGCRCGEALSLIWERIDFKNKTAYIPETKTGQPRTLHLPDIVLASLNQIRPEQATGRVFPWHSHQAINWAIRRAVGRYNKDKKPQDKIEFLSTHKIGSHSYATRMRRDAGMDLRGLMGTGRWTDTRSVARYAHTVASEEAKKSDLLPVPENKNRAKIVQSVRKRRKS